MFKSLVRKVPQTKLGVSEPDPSWFGNDDNEPKNPNWTNQNWLKSRFHFSFAEYNNPRNTNFSVLHVMNDDLVQPNRGFGEHPHRDAEICTYVVQGELTHADSMGTEETLQRGAIQFMTAGRGVEHSEHNLHRSEPLRFIQMWFTPRTRNARPNYGSFVGDAAARKNQWAHLVSDNQNPISPSPPIQINQDANIHVAELDAGRSVHFEVQEGRQAYLLCLEGSVTLQGSGLGKNDLALQEQLDRHDAAEIYGPLSFTLTAETLVDTKEGAHMLLVDMPYTGQGRRDL